MSSGILHPKKLLNGNEEAFTKIFGRFMFNIEQIEKTYCNADSNLVYDPKIDKILFDKNADGSTPNENQAKAECRKIGKQLLNHTMGSTLLSSLVQDPEEKSKKQIIRWKQTNKLFGQYAKEKLNITINENEEKEIPTCSKTVQKQELDSCSLAPYYGSQMISHKDRNINSNAFLIEENEDKDINLKKERLKMPKFINYYDKEEMENINYKPQMEKLNQDFVFQKVDQINHSEFFHQISTQQTYTLNIGDSEIQVSKRHTLKCAYDKPRKKENDAKQIFSSPDVVSAWVKNARSRASTGNVDMRELKRENEEYEERLNRSSFYGLNSERLCYRKRFLAVSRDNEKEEIANGIQKHRHRSF